MNRRQIDHPLVRRSGLCPMCGEAKSLGNVTCWGCHNNCEQGTSEQRTVRESCLDDAEEMLELENVV